MTVKDEVAALVTRLAGEPICDDCIAETLALPTRSQASRRTRELAGTRGYERSIDPCSICGTAKKVIRGA